jgi:hypothetical protein
MNVKLNFKQIILAGASAAGVSVVFNALLFLVFHSLGVLSDTVFVQPNEPLTIVAVIISSVFPTLLGACVFFLFEKYTNNGFKLFSIIAIVLMLLSLISPFTAIKDMPVSYGIVLDVMHVIVALSLLYFIKRAKK